MSNIDRIRQLLKPNDCLFSSSYFKSSVQYKMKLRVLKYKNILIPNIASGLTFQPSLSMHLLQSIECLNPKQTKDLFKICYNYHFFAVYT